MKPKYLSTLLISILTTLALNWQLPLRAEVRAVATSTAYSKAFSSIEGKANSSISVSLHETVLVVVNRRSDISQTIGSFYARKRNIPPSNICHLETSTDISVSRKLYEKEIRDPIAEFLKKNRLQDQILYIVTTRGVPAVIEGDSGIMGDLATVDSELTLLYRYLLGSRDHSFGKAQNPYFAQSIPAGRRIPFTRSDQDIYLVTRLTGKTPVDALALIDRGQSESDQGAFVFDLASQKRNAVYFNFQQAAEQLRSADLAVYFEDTSDLLKVSEPVMGYIAIVDQLNDSAEDLPVYDWSDGAIGYLFGGEWSSELRPEDGEDTSSPVPIVDKLIEQGIAGTALFLTDPGQPGYPSPQILFMAYQNGNNLAESFYLASQYLSWRQVVIGDPLLAPFGKERENQEIRLSFHAESGLPRYFFDRRMQFLQRKYLTSEEVLLSFVKAEAAYDRNELDIALSELKDSLRKDSTILESNLLYAEILQARGEKELAFDHFEKAASLGYRNPENLYRRLASLAMDELNDPAKAKPYVRWLFARTSYNDLQVVDYLGRIYLEEGNLDAAEKTFFRIVQQEDPAPLFALVGLGKVYLEKENLELAEEFLKRALDQPHSDASLIESILTEVDTLRDSQHQIKGTAPSGAVYNESTTDQSAAGQMTRRAKILKRTPPEYPKRAVIEGQEGYTILRLFIDERGQLIQSKCLKGKRLLCKASEKAVREWKFTPRLINGRPETDKMTVVIRFKLEKQNQ